MHTRTLKLTLKEGGGGGGWGGGVGITATTLAFGRRQQLDRNVSRSPSGVTFIRATKNTWKKTKYWKEGLELHVPVWLI